MQNAKDKFIELLKKMLIEQYNGGLKFIIELKKVSFCNIENKKRRH